MRTVRIAAVADVHSPRFLNEFKISLSELKSPDILLLAGDIVNFGKALEYSNVIGAINSRLGTTLPIVACFGNEEFTGVRNDILELTKPRVTFLDDEAITINHGGFRLGIVGTHAPFDSREDSKSGNDSDMRRAFERRARRLSRLLKDLVLKVDRTILLMHYSPLSKTKEEPNVNSFSWWISEATEDVQPDLVIHGHVHSPIRHSVIIGQTRTINVAFPARRKVTEIYF
ncbi:MAG: metallophosphoesterase family protein [Candidatus Thorarchaeota archaeon]